MVATATGSRLQPDGCLTLVTKRQRQRAIRNGKGLLSNAVPTRTTQACQEVYKDEYYIAGHLACTSHSSTYNAQGTNANHQQPRIPL
jgi:hypothetical protein